MSSAKAKSCFSTLLIVSKKMLLHVVAHNICASLPLGNCITALYICDLWKQCPSYPPSNLLIYDLLRLYAFGWFTATLALIVVGHQHIAAGWIHTHKSSWWCWDCCSQQEKFEQKQTNKDSNWYAFRCLKATSAVLILWVAEANWCYNNSQNRNRKWNWNFHFLNNLLHAM